MFARCVFELDRAEEKTKKNETSRREIYLGRSRTTVPMQRIIGIGIDLLDRRRLSRILMKSEKTRARLTRRILSGREQTCSEWTALAEVDSDSTALVSFLANRCAGFPLGYPLSLSLPYHSHLSVFFLFSLYGGAGIRWTAKEAAYKALYPLHTPTWKQLSLLKHSKKPCLLFIPPMPVSIPIRTSSINILTSLFSLASLMMAHSLSHLYSLPLINSRNKFNQEQKKT
ncbi:hypothetical protein H4Q26_007472 [Puccinia striiformis f. sp. tritici PST-130]|nr:hypothetical protein H4Q26_007472 [Puccinia striiformis f. sp. tritici PST-130]